MTTDHFIRSPLRRPTNAFQTLDNSIHNDEVAQPLGLRGGTVAGSVHMDQFPPLLVDTFGARWFESGSLSLEFKNATVHEEPVAVMVQAPQADGDAQVEARIEREDGLLVATGTASVGAPAEPSRLSSVDLRESSPSDLRMLASLEPGQVLVAHRGRVSSEEAAAKAAAGQITEPLPWYTGDSPWGGPIAAPAMLVRLLYRPTSETVTVLTGGAVGLFGAIEIRHLAGPVMADVDYDVESRLVCVGQSPKTEYLWFDSTCRQGDGPPIASMRMQLRYMKASSTFYRSED